MQVGKLSILDAPGLGVGSAVPVGLIVRAANQGIACADSSSVNQGDRVC